jgi:hypothetical protein
MTRATAATSVDVQRTRAMLLEIPVKDALDRLACENYRLDGRPQCGAETPPEVARRRKALTMQPQQHVANLKPSILKTTG